MQELVRNSYKNDIIFVDGFAKSGKIIIERILECFENVETHSEISGEIEEIFNLYNIGKIKEDAASILLQIRLDREIYNLNISRNLNTRFKDDSSIFKYPFPLKYLKRLFNDDRDSTDNYINSNKSILNVAIHGAITNSNILFNTFENRMKIIGVIRNPIDIINGINDYGIINRMYRSPSSTFIYYKELIENKEYIIPQFALNWKEQFIKMNPLEIIEMWYLQSLKSDLETYKNLTEKNKDNILLIDFDDMITKPKAICRQIEKFTNMKFNNRVYRVLKQQNCPRKLPKREKLNSECINVYNEWRRYARL